MIPKTYVDIAKTRLHDDVGAEQSVTDAQYGVLTNDVVRTVYALVPASRLTSCGVLEALPTVTCSNWTCAINLDDSYGPALVEGIMSRYYGYDAGDVRDAELEQRHCVNFVRLLSPGGQ